MRGVVSTEAPGDTPQAYRFGAFELQPGERRLLKDGEPVALSARAFDLLLALVERAGRLVSKDELLDRVWPKLVVEESNLHVHVSALRKLLGQDAIATVTGRGYRFAMALEDAGRDALPPLAVPGPTNKGGVRLRFRWMAIVAAIALIVISAALWHGLHGAGPPTTSRSGAVRSVAVLPFKRLYPGDSQDDYLSVGLADALIVHLGSLRRLIVRPTTSVLRYENTVDPLAAASEQRVDAVLTGTIQHTGNSIRVAAQLIDGANGASLWAGKFDEKPSDLLKLEDTLSLQIAQALLRQLDDSERARLAQRFTRDPDAYELYLRGRYQWSRFNEAGLAKAAEYHARAIEKDPSFALAYAGLAGTYNVSGAMGFETPRAVWPKVREYAEKAVALDANLAEAHVSLAAERVLYEWDFHGARMELNRAIELNPNLGDSYSLLSYVDQVEGAMPEAVEQVRRAVALEPNSALYNADLASAYYLAGRYSEAAAAWNRVAETDPGFNAAFIVGAQALERMGRYPEAIAECDRVAKVIGRTPPVLIAYAGVQEDEAAIQWLKRAIDSRDPQVLWFAAEPQLRRLSSHPEWSGLIKKVGLRLGTASAATTSAGPQRNP